MLIINICLKVTLPQLEVDESGDVFAVKEKGTKLKLNIHPVPITFGLFEEYDSYYEDTTCFLCLLFS